MSLSDGCAEMLCDRVAASAASVSRRACAKHFAQRQIRIAGLGQPLEQAGLSIPTCIVCVASPDHSASP